MKVVVPTVMTAALALAFTACGHHPPEPQNQNQASSEQPTPRDLVHADLAVLASQSDEGFINYDKFYGGVFTQIFGGTQGQYLIRYYNERIHYLVQMDDQDVMISPSHSKYSGWTRDPDLEANMKHANAKVGAANIGTGLWMQSVIDNQPTTLTLQGKAIPIDSTRAGIMLIGEGYEKTTQVRGQQIEIPAGYRQSILLHEARHSDCTQGTTQADLDLARKATTQREFSSKSKHLSCGHLHIYCPSGHQYQNLPACDGEPWGAYAVGSIYAKAMTFGTLPTLDWQIMNAVAIDSMSRVQIDTDAMMSGRLGPPDMSSTDQITSGSSEQ